MKTRHVAILGVVVGLIIGPELLTTAIAGAVASPLGCEIQILFWKYNTRTKRWTCAYRSTASLNDRMVGAVLVDAGQTIASFELRRDGLLIPTDTNVSVGMQSLLASEFAAQGFYHPPQQSLAFFRTQSPVVVGAGEHFEVSYDLSTTGGGVVSSGVTGLGGTTEADLLDGAPLVAFQAGSMEVASHAVPAVGRAAGVALGLGLGGAGLVLLRRGSRAFTT